MLQYCDDLKQYKKKLEHVNNIICDVASKNPNITPITAKDYALFEDFFAKEKKHTYGNSWIYITQGTFGIGPENLGYKYYDGKNLCAIAIYPKIEQPDIIMMYWIRPMGEDILSIIVELSEKIKREYNVCCYVKKLFPEQYEYLLQHEFRSAKEFPWHSSTHSEDDTYPELIFDREESMNAILNASRRSSLGSSLRNVIRLMRNNVIETRFDVSYEQALKVVCSFFSEYRYFAGKPNVSSALDYYNMIFCDYCDDVEKGLILVNKQRVGFYTLVRDKKYKFTIPYCSIMLRKLYKYLADFFLSICFKMSKLNI